MFLEEFRKNCKYLAVGIVSLVNQFDPGTIVIGDQLVQMEPHLLLDTVSRHLQQRLRPAVWAGLTIHLDNLEHGSIVMGAAALAANTILEDPLSYWETGV